MLGSAITRLQRAMLFPREYTRPLPTGRPPPGLEQWWIDSPDGPVEVWFLPGDRVDSAHPGPAVVFTHGNAELIDQWPHALARYRELGVSVLLPEYRGYGRSAGAPSEAAIAEDLRAVHDRLLDHPAVDAERLVYHGRSLGGGAACTRLDERPPRALILESTFTSVPAVAAGMFVPGFLIADRFENLEAVRRYDGPLLIFHGLSDRLIPVQHGRDLAAAHPNSELVLYACGHNDLPPPNSDYWARIESFLRRHGIVEPKTEEER